MALVINPMFSLSASGTFAYCLTMHKCRGGQSIVRFVPPRKNVRTMKQNMVSKFYGIVVETQRLFSESDKLFYKDVAFKEGYSTWKTASFAKLWPIITFPRAGNCYAGISFAGVKAP